MPDNVNITAGTGTTVAADEIVDGTLGTVKVQYVKLMDGTLDGSSKAVVSTNGGLSVAGSQSPVSNVAWTTANGILNASLSLAVTNLSTLTLAIVSTTTITAGILTFEVSMDNTNWITIMMARTDIMGVESSYTITASTSRAWSTSVSGFSFFRVRVSTAILGTGTVSVAMAGQAMPIEPVVNAAIIPNTVGGFSNFHLVSAATTNLTNLKASAGHVYGWYIYNSNAAARKVAFHNLATTPVAGANVFMSLVIPPGGGANVMNDIGIAFPLGIGISTTTGIADSDTTAVALNDLNINIWFK